MSTLILIELALVLGLVLGFGFWELYSLRRDKKRDAEREKPVAKDDDRDG